MLNPYQVYELERGCVRPEEAERKLELARWIREARGQHPGLRELVLFWLSDRFIALGEELRARSRSSLAGDASTSGALEYPASGS